MQQIAARPVPLRTTHEERLDAPKAAMIIVALSLASWGGMALLARLLF